MKSPFPTTKPPQGLALALTCLAGFMVALDALVVAAGISLLGAITALAVATHRVSQVEVPADQSVTVLASSQLIEGGIQTWATQ